jgi:arylsulfatase A-like enzyme
VFTADHGDMCGELGRHNKGIPNEGSARIPFVIRAPGLIPAGVVVKEALGTVDFKPTLLGLLGVPAGTPSEGRDASVLFRTGQAPNGWEDITFVRIGSVPGGWFGAFTNRAKLVLSPGGGPAFFDLSRDPSELRNAIDLPEHREEIRRLARALKEYGETWAEPLQTSTAVMADLDWAIQGKAGEPAPVHKPEADRAGKGKRGNAKARQKKSR